MFARMLNISAHIFPKIYQHPFNEKLYNGLLPKATFRHFLEQDELYLRDYSKALMLVSQKLANEGYDEKYVEQFKRLSNYIKITEREFHLNYLEERPNTFFSTKVKKIPIIKNYTKHLLDTAHSASIEEAIASLTPCFWIYCELGKQMDVSICPLDNPYRKWMTSYSDEQFTSETSAIVETIEELTKEIACSKQQDKILHSFAKSVEFEWGFFEAVYDSQAHTIELATSQALTL